MIESAASFSRAEQVRVASSILKLEAVSYSETLKLTLKPTRRQMLEDHNRNNHPV
jgi:hypothetical protein